MEQKDCYGILDRVFPVNNQGFREVTTECQECPDKVACLKSSLSTKEGIEFKAKRLDNFPANGLLGRIKRWSYRKELHRLTEQKKKEGNDS
jgi:hypothetical protein